MPESRPRRFSDIARQAEYDLDAAWGSDPAASPTGGSEPPSSGSGQEPADAGQAPAPPAAMAEAEVSAAAADGLPEPPVPATHAFEPDPATLADDPSEWADDDEPAVAEPLAPEPVAPDPMAPDPMAPDPMAAEPLEPLPRVPDGVAHYVPVPPEPSIEGAPVSFSDAVTTVMPAIERPDSPVHFDQPELTVAAVFGQRVSVGKTRVPLWSLFAAGVGLALLLGGAAARLVLGPSAVQSPLLTPSVTVSAAVAPSAGPPTLVDRAGRGDPLALRQLQQRNPAERSVDESLALARGREVERSAELQKLAERVSGKPAIASAPETLKRLQEFIADPRTATEALRVVAGLPGSVGPDILYEVWTGTKKRNDTTRLAEELVNSRDVRVKASPALLVALDLRRADDCDEVAAILPRAIQHGDTRALRMLGKLVRRTGCGPRKSKDCYPCLRDGEEIMDAINAVRKRRAPKFL